MDLSPTTTRIWLATRVPALAIAVACMWIQASSGDELMGIAGSAVLFGASFVPPLLVFVLLFDVIHVVVRRIAYAENGEGAHNCLYCGYQLDGYAQAEATARVLCPECGHDVVVAAKDHVA